MLDDSYVLIIVARAREVGLLSLISGIYKLIGCGGFQLNFWGLLRCDGLIGCALFALDFDPHINALGSSISILVATTEDPLVNRALSLDFTVYIRWKYPLFLWHFNHPTALFYAQPYFRYLGQLFINLFFRDFFMTTNVWGRAESLGLKVAEVLCPNSSLLGLLLLARIPINLSLAVLFKCGDSYLLAWSFCNCYVPLTFFDLLRLSGLSFLCILVSEFCGRVSNVASDS